MKKRWMRITAFCMAAILTIVSFHAPEVLADGVDEETAGYLVLGADLSVADTSTVLEALGVDDISEYTVSYCTNAEEHEAFDSYLPSSVIGTHAYSSILMVPAEEGSGITVSTSNISYVTVSMYQNALISAGISDVEVHVAAPFSVSGTCALVGAMNAYSIMTGEEISEDVSDAAAHELVATGDLGEEIGDNDTAAEMMAVLKEEVADADETLSEEELESAIDDACEEFGVEVSDDTKSDIQEVLEKLQDTDILDSGTLQEQASDLYESISGKLDTLIDSANSQEGILQRILNAIRSFFNWLVGLFRSDSAEEETEAAVTEEETQQPEENGETVPEETPAQTEAPAAETEAPAAETEAPAAETEATAAQPEPEEPGPEEAEEADDQAEAGAVPEEAPEDETLNAEENENE